MHIDEPTLATISATIIGTLATIIVAMIQKKQRLEDNKKNALPMLNIDLSTKFDSDNYNELRVEQKTKLRQNERQSLPACKLLKVPIRNVGHREMYNVRVVFCDDDNFKKTEPQDITPIIYNNNLSCMAINIITYMPSAQDYSVEFPYLGSKEPKTKLTFSILFDDCFKNSYQQKFSIDITYNYLKIIDGKYKGLYKDFENSELIDYEVLSAPENTNRNSKRKANDAKKQRIRSSK